jgi:hypothetical protein
MEWDMLAAVELQLQVNDQVRLLAASGDVRPGARGRVVGRFARPTQPSYFVAFEGQPAGVEVAADVLALHERAS